MHTLLAALSNHPAAETCAHRICSHWRSNRRLTEWRDRGTTRHDPHRTTSTDYIVYAIALVVFIVVSGGCGYLFGLILQSLLGQEKAQIYGRAWIKLLVGAVWTALFFCVGGADASGLQALSLFDGHLLWMAIALVVMLAFALAAGGLRTRYPLPDQFRTKDGKPT